MATTREMSIRDFIREFVEFFPADRAMQLVGFCTLYRLAGYPRPAALGERGFFGFRRAKIYRCLQDLRRFRLHLEELGYQRIGITDAASNAYFEQGIDEHGQPAQREAVDPLVDREVVDAVAGVSTAVDVGAVPVLR
jgi:hypothetical protein